MGPSVQVSDCLSELQNPIVSVVYDEMFRFSVRQVKPKRTASKEGRKSVCLIDICDLIERQLACNTLQRPDPRRFVPNHTPVGKNERAESCPVHATKMSDRSLANDFFTMLKHRRRDIEDKDGS